MIPGASQGCREAFTDCEPLKRKRRVQCSPPPEVEASVFFLYRDGARDPEPRPASATWSGALIGSSLASQLGSSSLAATVLWLRVRILTRSRLRERVLWLLSRGRLEPARRMGWAPGTDAQRLHLLSTVDRTGGDGSPLAGSTDSGGPLSPSDPAVGPAGRS